MTPSFAAFHRRAVGSSLAVSAVAAGLAALAAGLAPALGLGLGGGVGTLCLGLQGRQLVRGGPSPSAARRGALLRTGLRVGALAVGHLAPGVSLPWTAAGLFVAPAVLVLLHLRAPWAPVPRSP